MPKRNTDGLTDFERRMARKVMRGELTPEQLVRRMHLAYLIQAVIFAFVLGTAIMGWLWLLGLVP